MKKLKFEEGAITPLWLKDLEYMQEEFEKMLNTLVTGLGHGRTCMIVDGCKIIQDNTSISMRIGVAFVKGELLRVEPLQKTSCSDSEQRIYFTRKTRYDNSGRRNVISEGSSFQKDIYREEYLEPSLQETSDTIFSISKDFMTLKDSIVNSKRYKDTGLVVVNKYTDDLVDVDVKYRQIGGCVQLSGGILPNSNEGFSGIVAVGLPKPLAAFATIKPDQKQESCYIKIDTEGTLIVTNATGALSFADINYLSDPIYEEIKSDGYIIY